MGFKFSQKTNYNSQANRRARRTSVLESTMRNAVSFKISSSYVMAISVPETHSQATDTAFNQQ
jgi:hypothetical protein